MSFDDDLAAADSAVARYFDTRWFTATRMEKSPTAVNSKAAPSTTLVPFDFLGTLDQEPRLAAIAREQYAQPSTDANRQANRICLTALASCWPWIPQQGDKIEAWPAAAGEGVAAHYELVAAPDRDGTDRIVLWLSRTKAA